MNKFAFSLLAVIVTAGAGVAGYYLQQTGGRAPASESQARGPDHQAVIGQQRPLFELPNLAGEVRSISHWNGDTLVINFWATWCKPCKDEIPEFVELQEKYAEQDVTFVGVAIDQRQPVSDFAERYGMNYPVLVGEQAAIDAAKAYGNQLGALPYTAFVNRSGRIMHVHRGRLPKAEAERILRDLTSHSG